MKTNNFLSELVDKFFPLLTGNEVKTILVFYKKIQDEHGNHGISLSQLVKLCGYDKKTARKSIFKLIKFGFIEKVENHREQRYGLCLDIKTDRLTSRSDENHAAGLGAEAEISQEEFDKKISQLNRPDEIYKFLYQVGQGNDNCLSTQIARKALYPIHKFKELGYDDTKSIIFHIIIAKTCLKGGLVEMMRFLVDGICRDYRDGDKINPVRVYTSRVIKLCKDSGFPIPIKRPNEKAQAPNRIFQNLRYCNHAG